MRLLLESAIKSRCEGAWARTLPGKERRRWVLVFFQREVQGCIVEGALASGLSDQLIDDAFEDFLMAFTGEMAQDVAIGPDHHQRRPGPHRIDARCESRGH